jgi:hypothetical protein
MVVWVLLGRLWVYILELPMGVVNMHLDLNLAYCQLSVELAKNLVM